MRFEQKIDAPWQQFYVNCPAHLDYYDGTVSGAVFDSAARNPSGTAITFMGRHISYSDLRENIIATAAAFLRLGVRSGERVTVCLPNIPQAVYCLYGLNMIGAVPCMVHPLAAVNEIARSMTLVNSEIIVFFDQFSAKAGELNGKIRLKAMISASVLTELPALKRLFLRILKVGRTEAVPGALPWESFIAGGSTYSVTPAPQSYENEAVILFSGGTTGSTKAISLSNLNLNSLAAQTAAMSGAGVDGKKILAAMPVFHGFGLGVCVHTALFCAAEAILVPRVIVKEYARLITKEKPNYIAGVPSLYKAIMKNPYLQKADLSFLCGVFSGGDTLPVDLKTEFDAFLKAHGATVRIREGYGTTECVTASCLTPIEHEKTGSIGIPYPDTYYCICDKDCRRLPPDTEGEICITGPSVMRGYVNDDASTSDVLRVHDDGITWLHTGDLGTMDSDGYLYFHSRIKRLIVTNGYNVYPPFLERVICTHPAVSECCVIGVPDPDRMSRVKAYIVLKKGFSPDESVKRSVIDHCRSEVAKYALPREIEFIDELPKTLIGKVAYNELQNKTR